MTVDIDTATARAIKDRPEARQARSGVAYAARYVRVTAKENSPVVRLFVSSETVAKTSAFSANKTTYTSGANVSWPIWNTGITRAKVAQAKSDVEVARHGERAAELAIALDVRTAALSVMESSRRVQSASANANLAREALRLARVRYEAGVTTQVEVSGAEAAMTQALTNEVNAKYDYLSAQAQLERATASQPEYSRLVSSNPSGVGLEGVSK